MFAVCVTIYATFANQINCQNFDAENEIQCQKGANGTSTVSIGNIRFYIGDFFLEF